MSPGIIYKKKSCSTCGRLISIRNTCDHKIGEIYDGEMCCHIIEEIDITEVSHVPNPVQKYSVLWLWKDGKAIDYYDYSNVAYVAAGLRRPFDGWNLQYTQIRENHSQYKHVSRNDKCPCGSNIKYKNCCLKKDGVLKPHARILFEVPPPSNVPSFKSSKERFPTVVKNSFLSTAKKLESSQLSTSYISAAVSRGSA